MASELDHVIHMVDELHDEIDPLAPGHRYLLDLVKAIRSELEDINGA